MRGRQFDRSDGSTHVGSNLDALLDVDTTPAPWVRSRKGNLAAVVADPVEECLDRKVQCRREGRWQARIDVGLFLVCTYR